MKEWKGAYSMSDTIRLAAAEDATTVRDILFRAYEPIRKLELKWPAANATVELVAANIQRNECYVLEQDGDIAATLTYSLEGEVRDVTALPFIKWFAVDPLLQARGLGTKLMDWVERSVILGQHRAPAVTLATAARHPWLADMYRRNGYASILDFDPKNGDGVMHLMRKILDPALYEVYILEHPEDLASIHDRPRPVS